MSEEIIVKYCSPTMAGIKTGSLFSHSFTSKEELVADLRKYNALFTPKGLCMLPLKTHDNWALLYLFRRDKLQHDLVEQEAVHILENAGYQSADYRSCISKLITRFKYQSEFPHEIGLFLSYPPEDVRGFVENHAEGFKMVGYWKVYGDENVARRTFSEYDKCTMDYHTRLKKGKNLDSLIV